MKKSSIENCFWAMWISLLVFAEGKVILKLDVSIKNTYWNNIAMIWICSEFTINPVFINLFKVNNRNTRTRCTKTSEQRLSVFIGDFGQTFTDHLFSRSKNLKVPLVLAQSNDQNFMYMKLWNYFWCLKILRKNINFSILFSFSW